MPRISYVSEKMGRGTQILADGRPVRERIESAAMAVTGLRREDFEGLDDQSLPAQFDSLMARLDVAQGPSGSIAASVRAMTDTQAEEWVGDFINLAFAAEKEYGRRLGTGQSVFN